MSEIPATRSLAAVLRDLSSGEDQCRLLVGRYGVPISGPDGRTYASIQIGDQTLRVPKLSGTADGSEGQPAYILATPGRMLVIGTVSN